MWMIPCSSKKIEAITLAAPCFNCMKHNDCSSIMLHGLRAVRERLPGDLQHSLSWARGFWGKKQNGGVSQRLKLAQQAASSSTSSVTDGAISLLSVRFQILSLVLAGVELQPWLSLLLSFLLFFTLVVPLPHSVSHYEGVSLYVHMLNIFLPFACIFFFFI